MTLSSRFNPLFMCRAFDILMNQQSNVPDALHTHFDFQLKLKVCSRCMVLADVAQSYKVRSRLVPLVSWPIPRAPHDGRKHRSVSPGYFETRLTLSEALLNNSIENNRRRDKAFMGDSFLKKVPKEEYMRFLLRSTVI